MQRPTLVESIVLAGSPLLRETPDTKAMVLTLLHGFPYVPWKLQLALHVCFGQGDVAVIQRWGDVWKDRYGGSAGKEEIFRKCVEQFSERDDVGGRLAEMGEAMRVHVLHVSIAGPEVGRC